MARMEQDLAWFRELPAEDRSWVGMIVQAGIREFIVWYRRAGDEPAPAGNEMVASVFGAAPRALTGVITHSLTELPHRTPYETAQCFWRLFRPATAAIQQPGGNE